MPGDFTDLLAWQEASALVADAHRIARLLRGIGAIQAAEQIISSAESISANIAEGYGRGISRDYCRFLRIAIGSATEFENRVRNAVSGRGLPEGIARPVIERARPREP